MVLTPEQADKIKEQLLIQVESLPQENKEQIKEHIKNLDEIELEEFLRQNKIAIRGEGSEEDGENEEEISEEKQTQKTQCVFCSIAKSKIPSHKIAENKKAIAVLEINPLSKGHSIIIPLEHISIEDLSKTTLGLAKKITKKIRTKLKPDDVKIETSSFQGHALINVIPVYNSQKLAKRKAEESELNEIRDILEIKKRGPRNQRGNIVRPSSEKLPKISFRIP
jgi:histidine triad (HIT) family protein